MNLTQTLARLTLLCNPYLVFSQLIHVKITSFSLYHFWSYWWHLNAASWKHSGHPYSYQPFLLHHTNNFFLDFSMCTYKLASGCNALGGSLREERLKSCLFSLPRTFMVSDGSRCLLNNAPGITTLWAYFVSVLRKFGLAGKIAHRGFCNSQPPKIIINIKRNKRTEEGSKGM